MALSFLFIYGCDGDFFVYQRVQLLFWLSVVLLSQVIPAVITSTESISDIQRVKKRGFLINSVSR